MMFMLLKETRPFLFFSYIALALMGLSVFFMAPVLLDYFETGLVDRMPTWVLSMTLMLCAMLSFSAGVILDSVSRGRAEQKRIFYLSVPAARGEKYFSGTTPIVSRRKSAAQ